MPLSRLLTPISVVYAADALLKTTWAYCLPSLLQILLISDWHWQTLAVWLDGLQAKAIQLPPKSTTAGAHRLLCPCGCRYCISDALGWGDEVSTPDKFVHKCLNRIMPRIEIKGTVCRSFVGLYWSSGARKSDRNRKEGSTVSRSRCYESLLKQETAHWAFVFPLSAFDRTDAQHIKPLLTQQ